MILSINTNEATVMRFKRFILSENMRRSEEAFKGGVKNGKYEKITSGQAVNMLIDLYESQVSEDDKPEEYDEEIKDLFE